MSDTTKLTIDTLVPGGQGIATSPTGQKVFVWNALPGEVVMARVIKRRHSYAEAVAEEIIVPSAERVTPKESNYLATSPWQMMTFDAENKYKRLMAIDIYNQHKLTLLGFDGTIHDHRAWQYRNKMEYSFWGDDEGLHL